MGLNAFHGDSSACIIRDGLLEAAVEEERFRRIKHWAGFPSMSIEYCLRHLNIKLRDIDYVAINQAPNANLWQKFRFSAKRATHLATIIDRLKDKRERRGVVSYFESEFPDDYLRAKLIQVEHHHAHMASAYFVSPFREATVVSVDGFGDFASTAWGKGVEERLSVEKKIYFPHSLGIFYQALTQYLGFPNYGDEYKIMGLAPYGRPQQIAKMRHIVHLHDDGTFALNLKFFRHGNGKVEYEWRNGEPKVGTLFSDELIGLLGPARAPTDELTNEHKNIARSVQAMYEEALFHLLSTLHRRHATPALALAGGCAMNSVANGRVYANTPYKRVYVQAAAGDAGGAIGAALVALKQTGGARGSGIRPRQEMRHAYCGPEYSNDEIGELLSTHSNDISAQTCTSRLITDEPSLLNYTAQAIADGKIVGWFQGRMEWGPRALGNRSILADPRRADIKEVLNLKIKRRESFRPFAPSVLRESVREWFETDDDVPFMMQVFQVREPKRSLVPAITHVDGSGRLQTVTERDNDRYYRLINAFYGLTKIPMVLNTSFNENEPVVCTPTEALACFLRTKMDVLVLGDWVICRNDSLSDSVPPNAHRLTASLSSPIS